MSHNNFSAFFSGGDDKDEVAGKLFGVIGNLDTDTPSHVWRAGFNRQTKSLNLEDIFDINLDTLTASSNYSIDYVKAISNISERKPKTSFQSSITYTKKETQKVSEVWDYLDSFEDEYQSSRNIISNIKFNLDSVLTKGTIFNSHRNEELGLFVYDFNTLFQKNKSIKDQDIYNIFASLSTLVFENIDCDSEVYNGILEEISKVYESNN